MTENEISETLEQIVPHREVPAGLLAGARLRRRRTRSLTGAAALALVAAVAVPLGLALGGLGSGGGAFGSEDLHGASAVLRLPLDGTPHTGDVATASSRIAWSLMVADDEVRSTNTVIAPSSLAVTLAMLAEGATGRSETSLDEAFGLSGDDRSAAMGALRQALSGYEDLPTSVDAEDPPESPVLHQANRVVILDDADITQDFLDRLASYYDTGANRLPRGAAAADLDAWAKKHTAGLIKESAVEITPETRLITQDALLFAARWRNEFENDDILLPFTTGSGTTANLDALGGTFDVPYATGDRWEAVRLPYDDSLAMDVIVPSRGVHPSELDFDTINATVAALGKADETSIAITMPPSDIKTEWDLLKPLETQGIDLSEMSGIFGGAYVDQVAQQVRLTVTAKGTVGAALTEGVAAESSGPLVDVELAVDRPFIMRVLDTRTGWPLFFAIVNDPADLPD